MSIYDHKNSSSTQAVTTGPIGISTTGIKINGDTIIQGTINSSHITGTPNFHSGHSGHLNTFPWTTSSGMGYSMSPNGNFIPASLEDQAKAIELAELNRVKQAERLEALKTHFPRAHQNIQNLDIMEDIARENQLNPLYEQLIKEFDEAKAAMSRAANKLASGVKLTDSEEVDSRAKKLAANQAYGQYATAGASSVSAAYSARTSATLGAASATTANTSAANAVYSSSSFGVAQTGAIQQSKIHSYWNNAVVKSEATAVDSTKDLNWIDRLINQLFKRKG